MNLNETLVLKTIKDINSNNPSLFPATKASIANALNMPGGVLTRYLANLEKQNVIHYETDSKNRVVYFLTSAQSPTPTQSNQDILLNLLRAGKGLTVVELEALTGIKKPTIYYNLNVLKEERKVKSKDGVFTAIQGEVAALNDGIKAGIAKAERDISQERPVIAPPTPKQDNSKEITTLKVALFDLNNGDVSTAKNLLENLLRTAQQDAK